MNQQTKNQSVVYQLGLAASAASQKPAGWPRLNAGALPLGVMVFAFLDDFVNLGNLHIKHGGKKLMPPPSCGNMHIPPNVMAHFETPTMRIVPILILLISLFSCEGLQKKRHFDFISKVEAIGLDKFRNIEYGTRGSCETYNYCLENDSSISWVYNRKIEQFEFPLVNQKTNKISTDFHNYTAKLREEIKQIDIVMITQSPWCGNIIRFWYSDDEIVEYVDPNFKFDDRFKNEWLKEIKSGQKIKDDWYYIKINK